MKQDITETRDRLHHAISKGVKTVFEIGLCDPLLQLWHTAFCGKWRQIGETAYRQTARTRQHHAPCQHTRRLVHGQKRYRQTGLMADGFTQPRAGKLGDASTNTVNRNAGRCLFGRSIRFSTAALNNSESFHDFLILWSCPSAPGLALHAEVLASRDIFIAFGAKETCAAAAFIPPPIPVCVRHAGMLPRWNPRIGSNRNKLSCKGIFRQTHSSQANFEA